MKKTISWILISVIVLGVVLVVVYNYRKKAYFMGKLSARYHEGLKVVVDRHNSFYPEGELAYYDSMLVHGLNSSSVKGNTPEQRKMYIQFFRAYALLKLGKENEVIQILLQLDKELKSDTLKEFASEVRKNLALAYLRLGERNNCITNHSNGSCIFPIMGKGVYTDPSASNKGIEIFEEILRKDSNDLSSRWLLNVAYMTVGGYPDRVPRAFLIPGLDTDTSSVKVKPFEDMAMGLKLTGSQNEAGGSIIDDFDNDGFLDIVTSSWGLEEQMHYYKNNGDGTFKDLSKESGISEIKGGLNIQQVDYNNDGYLDILILRGAWQREFGKQPKTLLKNNGDGTFTDVTVESGILSYHPSQAAAWADFNNDGWLDLFIANETTSEDLPHPGELYINNHDGTFTNVANEAQCDGVGFIKGVTVADYNKDGWPDIFLSSLDGHKVLLKNKGIKSKIPQFENATHEAGLDRDITYTFPTWFWDYDNDGWPDIFVCGYGFTGSLGATAAAEALNKPLGDVSKMYLYRNNHDGTFTNVAKDVGLDRPVFAMGSNYGDIDNDGWLDMYLGTGNPDYRSLIPNRLFKNIDGKKFVDVTSSARVGNLQKGHEVSFADVDNDGDQDIFIEVGGAYVGDSYYNSFYINPGQNDNNWISISLEGVQTNRSAIGAHIAATFTEAGLKRTVYNDVNTGGSFGSSSLRKEIGIGKATVIDELTITWPTSGKVQVFKNVKPKQFIKIREGKDIEILNIKSLKLKMQMDHMDMNMKMSAIDCAPTDNKELTKR